VQPDQIGKPVVAEFEFRIPEGVIPKRPRLYQRAEESRVAHRIVAGDASTVVSGQALRPAWALL
jgi:hypothetical protein